MPFCQRCGSKLEDTARFCPSCGQAVISDKETPTNIEEKIKGFLQITPEMEQEQLEARENPAPPAGNLKNRHFREQFARIKAGKPLELKYNLFSMVFGPFQQLYHKSYSLFAKTYLPVLLLLAIDVGLSTYAGLTFDLTLLTVSLILNGIGLFWGLITAILNGKNYVHALYKQTDGNADAIPASPLSVVLGCVALAAAVGLSNWLGYSLAMAQWQDELQSIPAYSEQDAPQDEWNEDIFATGLAIIPNDYVVVPAETPWYGVWQDPVRGYRFTYEESLNYCSEQAQQLEDGSYHFPFIIYREQMKNHSNISMANQGFEHPCELMVKDHQGLVYLTVKTVSAQSAFSGKQMEGRIQKLQYLCDGEFRDGGMEGRYIYFPATALQFISMGKGRDTLLHGSVCLKMQCSVGEMHMPESTAVFTVFIH